MDMDEAVWGAEINGEESDCVALCHFTFLMRARWEVYLVQVVRCQVYHPEYRRSCMVYLSNRDAELGVVVLQVPTR